MSKSSDYEIEIVLEDESEPEDEPEASAEDEFVFAPGDYSGEILYDTEQLGLPTVPKIFNTQDLAVTAGFLEPDIVNSIKKMVMNMTKNSEVEISFGRYPFENQGQGTFYPGVPGSFSFEKVRRWLESQSTSIKRSTDVVDNITAIKEYRRITTLKTENKSVVFQRKIRSRGMIDIKKYGMRVSSSEEEVIPSVEIFSEELWRKVTSEEFSENVKGNRAVSRSRDRVTYEFNKFKVDTTYVKTVNYTYRGESYTRTTYEIEVELSPNSVFDEVLYVLHGINSSIRGPVDVYQIQAAAEVHNKLFENTDPDVNPTRQKSMQRPQRKDALLHTAYWSKPVDIRVKTLLSLEYIPSVTIKYNGTRVMILYYSGGIYGCLPPNEMYYIGPVEGEDPDPEDVLLFDSELFQDKYYVFDAVASDGKLLNEEFNSRIGIVKKVVGTETEPVVKDVLPKKYFTEGCLYDRTVAALDEAKKMEPGSTDGLILQNITKYLSQSYKWKPSGTLTIDFLLRQLPTSETDPVGVFVFQLLTSNGKLFTGTKAYPHNGIFRSAVDTFDGVPLDGAIVEMSRSTNRFEIVRLRTDRDQPNSGYVARDVWDLIHDPVTEKTIRGQDLVLYRKYSNAMKRKMYLQYASVDFGTGKKLLDIGVGRGGDLSKWEEAKIDTVVGVDPNEKNIKELISRYNFPKTGRRWHVQVIAVPTGAENTEHVSGVLQRGKITLDAVSAFHSLTFFAKSKELLNELAKTVNLVAEGGIFFGVFFDGQSVEDLLGTDRKVVTDAWSVRRERRSKRSAPNEIVVDIPEESSMVHQQHEWLLKMQELESVLEPYGFQQTYAEKLTGDVLSQSFRDRSQMLFNNLPPESQRFALLHTQFAFVKKPKTVPVSELISQGDLIIARAGGSAVNYFYACIINTDTRMQALASGEADVAMIREEFAKSIKFDTFMAIGDGDLSKKMIHEASAKYDTPEQAAFVQFKLEVIDTSLFLDDSVLGLPMSQYLGASIYLIDTKGNNLRPPIKPNKSNNRNIVLVSLENTRTGLLQTVGYKRSNGNTAFIFPDKHSLIRRLEGTV